MSNANPIAFNPDTMTVSQVKKCAETLRAMFDLIDRDASPDDIAVYLKQSRDYFVRHFNTQV